MLATVLKSQRAVEATFAIIETYAEVRAMKRELLALHTEKDAHKRNSMMRHFGEVLTYYTLYCNCQRKDCYAIIAENLNESLNSLETIKQ